MEAANLPANNPGLEDQFAELSLEGVRRKIQHWLDRQGGYPKEHTSKEYGFYIKRCFPITSDRSAFFQQKVWDAHPHVGYRLLCHLAEAELVHTVWSTNFDGLPARAAAGSALTVREVGIDSQSRISRAPSAEFLLEPGPVASICSRRSGEAFRTNQSCLFAETASVACDRGCGRASAARGDIPARWNSTVENPTGDRSEDNRIEHRLSRRILSASGNEEAT
jgi:hypothetical protein